MKKFLFLALLMIIIFSVSKGQGTVRGKVSDESGETLIGVPIILKSNPKVGTVTDLDGNYSIKINDGNAQTLVFSYVGYKSVEVQVNPVNGEVISKNIVLVSAVKEIKEVQITAKAIKARDYYIENVKRNSATTLDYVSSESMKKTGDANVTAAVARVSGVSTNGAFITVRGIGDRYVKTAINGSRIPTLDPFTNNIKLDLFPASLVDNIIITKTASPDLPGDWAGAYLSIETKDYPDQLSVNVESTFGYNNQTSFKDIVSSEHSKTDWLGYDNSLRDHNHLDFTPTIINPNQYQQFVALGLGNYYSSLGVTGSTPWNDYYYKLGLVQLGLLAPAMINDPVAFTNAKNQYAAGPYSGQAFSIINANAVKTSQSFANTWSIPKRMAPLDFSQSFSVGNQTTLFGKPLGFIAGLRYGSSIVYDPNSLAERIYAETGPVSDPRVAAKEYRQLSKETNGWSALFNLAYKLTQNNTVSILFMPNYNGVNNVKDGYDVINYKTTLAQFYEERKQMVYQFKSEHYIPDYKLKIETNASYTKGTSNAPDFRELVYKYSGSSTITIDPTNDPADRFYRYLTDNLFDSRISAEFPIGNKTGLTRKIKFGGSYQNDQQKFDQYTYHVNVGNRLTAPSSTDVSDILSLNNFGINNNTVDWYYSKEESPINHTFGRSDLTAGYALADYSILPRLRVSGGIRMEKANIYTDVFLYDSLGYAKDDIRRSYAPGMPNATPGKLNEISYLPSANIIYKLKNSEDAPINVRVNYSQTVARPSIRELSVAKVFDYELQANVTGNPNLKMVNIYNYDLRIESYFKSGNNLSVSFFYKDFKNHIELEYSDTYHWQNVNKSNVKGIEVEGKLALTKQLEFRANVTFAQSTTTFVRTRQETAGGVTTTFYEDTIKRPMFGQAPYVINGILSYNLDKQGLILTLTYNVQGPRLVIASNVASIPDVYELDRNLIDFKVSKKLSKHFSASITAKNLFNAPLRRSYKAPDGYKLYDRYSYGTNYLVSLSYKL